MLGWLRRRRRRTVLMEAFPAEWRRVVDRIPVCAVLSPDERERLHAIVQVLMAEKRFEGCGGLALTDEMRVSICAQAALLVLELGVDAYAEVTSVLVYPTTYVAPRMRRDPIGILHGQGPLAGEAWPHGPVVVAWEHVEATAAAPERGDNVVMHEFAHHLDMQDGVADGVPPLERRVAGRVWAEAMRTAYEEVAHAAKAGAETLLDEYGATDPAEFFAVATTCFFTRPRALEDRHPSLYAVLRAYYRQDPAARREPAGRPRGGR